MMEFWPENQGQRPPYARFGTVPGRGTQSYHDRHYYPPVYYGDQPGRGRESAYWTMAGWRAGASVQEYASWADPELPASTSAHFPFVLDRHTQQHPSLTDCELQEGRDRKWTAAQQTAREYETGFLREVWSRRWEPCGPVHDGRDASKRSESSYRELEAWAARYSHSLPRKKRIEAELRGASERDGRTDSRLVRSSAKLRDSGFWDRAVRQQTYPTQVPDISHMLGEKAGHHKRAFSQPPGYIAPPPYNSPHKCSPASLNSSLEQEATRQSYWTQPPFGKDAPLTRRDSTEKDQLREESQKKGSGDQKTSPGSSRVHDPQLHEQPQTVPAAPKIREDSPKVIEGRTFRLKKKTGGLTIFCLVSRIASVAESVPSPGQTNPELGEPSTGGDIDQKIADEVDHKQAETPARSESTRLLSDEDEVSLKETNKTDNPTCQGQVVPSVPLVRYPLWKEPSSTSRAEAESPLDVEGKRLDVKRESESEEGKGLLVIDTTSIIVKMELIPSPKKELVHYLGSTAAEEHGPCDVRATADTPSNGPLDQCPEVTPSQMNESQTKCDLVENESLEAGGEISVPVSGRETLEMRAERILGIALRAGDEARLLDLSVKDQREEADCPQVNSTEDQRSQSPCGNDEGADLVAIEGDERSSGSPASEERNVDSLLGHRMTEDLLVEAAHEDRSEESPRLENEPPPFLGLPPDLSDVSSDPSLPLIPSPSAPTLLSCTSESNTDEDLDPPPGITPSQHPPSPTPPLLIPTAEDETSADPDEERPLIEYEMGDAVSNLSKDTDRSQGSDRLSDSGQTIERLSTECSPDPQIPTGHTTQLNFPPEACERTRAEDGQELEVEDTFCSDGTENNPPPGLLDKTTTEENAKDCEDTELLMKPGSSFPDGESCPSSPSSLGLVPVLDPEPVPCPLLLLSPSENPLQSSPPRRWSGHVSPDLLHKEEEPLCPKSLWDAVNRIRKHTAPDSENEDEEVNELWDPESAGEDAKHEAEGGVRGGGEEVPQGRTVEDAEVEQTDLCSDQPNGGHAEDDTLSCSSTSSHDSGDTVIGADQEEQEATSDVETGSRTEPDEELQPAAGAAQEEDSQQGEEGEEKLGEANGELSG